MGEAETPIVSAYPYSFPVLYPMLERRSSHSATLRLGTELKDLCISSARRPMVSRGRSSRLAQARVRVRVRHDVIPGGAVQRYVELNRKRFARVPGLQAAGHEIAQEQASIGMDGTGAQGRRLIGIQVGIGRARVQSGLEIYGILTELAVIRPRARMQSDSGVYAILGGWQARARRRGHRLRRLRRHEVSLGSLNAARTLLS